ncbi:hypothetical protein OS493_030914 [Desmophyllum pertusum]|uniref:Uncharacterized protein n=1 Tax=Desmophyllum pertusum TaxID=174260 RepID=A0A9X0A0R6_9CNID|nr:hypothetical protein OS493_030914 [Desmophyllum pertusum]
MPKTSELFPSFTKHLPRNRQACRIPDASEKNLPRLTATCDNEKSGRALRLSEWIEKKETHWYVSPPSAQLPVLEFGCDKSPSHSSQGESLDYVAQRIEYSAPDGNCQLAQADMLAV